MHFCFLESLVSIFLYTNRTEKMKMIIPTKNLISMKKLIIATAVILGTLTSINAQSSFKETPSKAQVASSQDGYKEVKTSELPQAVKDAIAKDLEGAIVSKAYANEKGEFKLVVTTPDKLSKTLYANSKGEWIKKQ